MIQRTVESFVIPAVKDEQLPVEVEGFGPGASYVTALLTECPAVFTNPQSKNPGLPFNDTDPYADRQAGPQLAQTSRAHIRSFEVHDDELPEVWHDEFGHTYGSLTLKGNNFSYPAIIETLTASERVIAYGLQESAVIRRVLRASRLLRSAGVGTEYLLGLAEPKEFPFAVHGPGVDSHVWLDPNEYKNELVTRQWNQYPAERKTAEELVSLQQKFSRMTFYISARAMDTPVRLSELGHINTRTRAFDFANKNGYVQEGQPDFDPSGEGEVGRFLREVVLPRLAKNLVIMHHELRLAHRYPVEHNLSALGSIIDLDSVHGAALELGDEEITAEDIVNDLMEATNAVFSVDGWNLSEYFKDIEEQGKDEQEQPKQKKEFVHRILLRLYAEELEKLDAPLFTAAEIAYATQSVSKEDQDNRFTIFLSKPIIGNIIFDIFHGDSFEYKPDVDRAHFRHWYEDYMVNSADEVQAGCEDFYDDLLGLLFDEMNYSGDINTDRFLEKLFGEDGLDWTTGPCQFVLDSLQDIAMQAYAKELEGAKGGAEIIALCQNLVKDGTGWGAISELADKLITGWKDRIAEDMKIHPYQPFVSGENATLMFRSRGNIFVHEESEVPMAALLAACETDDVERLIVKRFQKPGDKNIRRIIHDDATPDYKLSESTYILTHVISDDYTDGYSHGTESDDTEFDLTPNGGSEYVAFVEQMPDGKKTVQIHIIDSAFDQASFEGVDKSTAIRMLRSTYEYVPRLFPIHDYYEKKKPIKPTAA